MRSPAPAAEPESRADEELGRRGRSGFLKRHRALQRGATLVEYALLMAALVIPTIVAITYVQDSAETEINRTATGISSKTIPPVPANPGG